MRNDVVGHPADRGNKSGRVKYFMLNQNTITKRGFKVVLLDGKNRDYDKFYDIEQAIQDQIAIIKKKDEVMAEELRRKQLEHRKRFRGQKLTSIFNSADYFLSTLVADLDGRGIPMINLLSDMLDRYEQAVHERGEAPEQLAPPELRYALCWLKQSLNGDLGMMNVTLSRIVALYIRNDYPVVIKGAEYLDEEYASEELP